MRMGYEKERKLSGTVSSASANGNYFYSADRVFRERVRRLRFVSLVYLCVSPSLFFSHSHSFIWSPLNFLGFNALCRGHIITYRTRFSLFLSCGWSRTYTLRRDLSLCRRRRRRRRGRAAFLSRRKSTSGRVSPLREIQRGQWIWSGKRRTRGGWARGSRSSWGTTQPRPRGLLSRRRRRRRRLLLPLLVLGCLIFPAAALYHPAAMKSYARELARDARRFASSKGLSGDQR